MVAHDHTNVAKESYERFKTAIASSEAKLDATLAKLTNAAEARKEFNQARQDFNGAQAEYRKVEDVMEHSLLSAILMFNDS